MTTIEQTVNRCMVCKSIKFSNGVELVKGQYDSNSPVYRLFISDGIGSRECFINMYGEMLPKAKVDKLAKNYSVDYCPGFRVPVERQLLAENEVYESESDSEHL